MTSAAKGYLELLQREAFEKSSRVLEDGTPVLHDTNQFRFERTRNFLMRLSRPDSYLKRHHVGWDEFQKTILGPTDFEFMHRALDELCDVLQTASQSIYGTSPERPSAGSIPSETLNGQIYIVPNTNEYLIVLNEGLVSSFNALANLISIAAPIRADGPEHISVPDSKLGIDHFVNSHEHVDQFVEALHHILRNIGSVSFSIPGDDLLANSISHKLFRLLNLFAVAHEYGHLIHDHFREMPREKEFSPSVVQEYEADMAGHLLVMEVVRREDGNLMWAAAGPDVFFSCLAVIEDARDLLKVNQASNSLKTHLPPLQRRDLLRRLLADRFIPNIWGQACSWTLESLWARGRDQFVKT